MLVRAFSRDNVGFLFIDGAERGFELALHAVADVERCGHRPAGCRGQVDVHLSESELLQIVENGCGQLALAEKAQTPCPLGFLAGLVERDRSIGKLTA